MPRISDAVIKVLKEAHFVSITEAEVLPDDATPELYQGWQITTESPNGGMLAVSICDPQQGNWWSYPTEFDQRFGYHDWDKAKDWARTVIDQAIAAQKEASGQMALFEMG